jgi:hypothetical protein
MKAGFAVAAEMDSSSGRGWGRDCWWWGWTSWEGTWAEVGKVALDLADAQILDAKRLPPGVLEIS